MISFTKGKLNDNVTLLNRDDGNISTSTWTPLFLKMIRTRTKKRTQDIADVK